MMLFPWRSTSSFGIQPASTLRCSSDVPVAIVASKCSARSWMRRGSNGSGLACRRMSIWASSFLSSYSWVSSVVSLSSRAGEWPRSMMASVRREICWCRFSSRASSSWRRAGNSLLERLYSAECVLLWLNKANAVPCVGYWNSVFLPDVHRLFQTRRQLPAKSRYPIPASLQTAAASGDMYGAIKTPYAPKLFTRQSFIS
jgi:hypothetical protein